MRKIEHSAVVAFTKFIAARERHRVAKVAGRAVDKPDPIISQYRFCNVRRNDDRVSQWIHQKYLEEWRGSENLWFALLVARLFNNEDTLAYIMDNVIPFKPEVMRKKLHHRRDRGVKNFNAAYIVSTNGRTGDKIDYVIDHVLVPAWADRKRVAKLMQVGQLANVHLALCGLNGLASFMAAQIVADLKYAFPAQWVDFHTFAASGPGSKRGLNRVMGRPIDTGWNELEFRDTLNALRDKVNTRLTWEPITAHDIQNCLCEYDKYERARLGEGRPKQLYKPKGGLPWE
jgi:hypothetical protein